MKNIISLWKKPSPEKGGKLLGVFNAVLALTLMGLTFWEYLAGKEHSILFYMAIEFLVALVSVVMTVSTQTCGFVLSLAVNVIRVGHYAVNAMADGGLNNIQTAYGLIFSLTVISVVSLVYIILFRINSRLKPLLKENSERNELIEEAKAANERVEESSRIIDKNEKELYHLAF